MAKAKKQIAVPDYLDNWKAELALGVLFLAASYGFISLALNSARLIEYVLGILFLVSGIKTLFKAVRRAFKR